MFYISPTEYTDMKTSQVGINSIKREEGRRLKAYRDSVGVWTIGYGDTLGVYPGMEITQQEAEDRLARRLANEFEPAVNRVAAHAATTQAQFDAMVSLAWNIGIYAFEHNSSVARHHRAGEYALAADAFRFYNQAGGKFDAALAGRRERERLMYLSDTGSGTEPSPSPPNVFDVQERLVALGHDIAVDGIAGPHTCEAVLAELSKRRKRREPRSH